MADLALSVDLEASLRQRVSRFFANHAVWKAPLRQLVARIEEQQWPAVVFGGVLRDLMVFGLTERPRDVDIVVDDVSADEVARVFADSVYRRTRFGGLSLRAQGWLIDIWPLKQTWAFQNRDFGSISFGDLPKTTFLNVEAAAADLTTQRGRERRIFTNGFFDSIQTRTLEINFAPNPFPQLCVVRSLITAARINFRIGPELAKYIVVHAKQVSIDELVATQLSHYGSVRCGPDTLQNWLSTIDASLACNPSDPVLLPVSQAKQLALCEDWSPAC